MLTAAGGNVTGEQGHQIPHMRAAYVCTHRLLTRSLRAGALCLPAVRSLTKESCLYAAGLREGDRIDQIDGVAVAIADTATALLKQKVTQFEILITRELGEKAVSPVIETSLSKESAEAPLAVDFVVSSVDPQYLCVAGVTQEMARAGITVEHHVLLLGTAFPSSVAAAHQLWAEAPVGQVVLIVEQPAPRV